MEEISSGPGHFSFILISWSSICFCSSLLIFYITPSFHPSELAWCTSCVFARLIFLPNLDFSCNNINTLRISLGALGYFSEAKKFKTIE